MSTTDFFDTHRAQCVYAASKLRAVPEAADLVDTLDASVALCDDAIAKGRLRKDMTAAVTKLQEGVAKYEAMPAQKKTDFQTARKADVPPAPKPRVEGATK